MNINLSGFRQEVSKVRLSETAFNELLNATNALEVGEQNERLDMRPACIDPIRHHVLSTELRNLRDLINHERLSMRARSTRNSWLFPTYLKN